MLYDFKVLSCWILFFLLELLARKDFYESLNVGWSSFTLFHVIEHYRSEIIMKYTKNILRKHSFARLVEAVQRSLLTRLFFKSDSKSVDCSSFLVLNICHLCLFVLQWV